jgi:hypothetical protein
MPIFPAITGSIKWEAQDLEQKQNPISKTTTAKMAGSVAQVADLTG